MLISFLKDGRTLSFGSVSTKIEKLGFESMGGYNTGNITLTLGSFQNLNADIRFLQDVFLSSLWDVATFYFEDRDDDPAKSSLSRIVITKDYLTGCVLDQEFGFGSDTITIQASQYTLVKKGIEEKTQQEKTAEEKAVDNLEKTLDRIGVSIKNSNEEYRPIIDILTEVVMKWETIDLNNKLKTTIDLNNKLETDLEKSKIGLTTDLVGLGVISPSTALSIIEENQIENNKEDNSMNNIFSNIFGDIDFGKITTSRIKYSMNGIAFSDKNSKYMVYKDNRAIDVTGMTIDAPLFAMPVAANQIKVGDIIRFKNNYVIVKELVDDGLKIINPIDGDIKTIIPEVNVFNFNYYTKIISPFESIGATANENNPFGNFLPLMMFSGDTNNGNDSNMFKYMMLSQMCGGAIDFSNPMMMYMLMGDKEFDPMALMFMNGHFMKVENKGE